MNIRNLRKEKQKEQRIKNIVVGSIYIIFIVFMIVMVRLNESSTKKEKEDNKNITNSNYYFTYILNIDDEIYYYEGKRFNDKQSFKVTNNKESNEYYLYRDIALIKKDKDYVLIDKPAYFINYFDTNEINQIINMAEYDKKEKIYKLTTTNFALVYDLDINDKSLNTIKLEYKDNHLYKVKMDYTNYVIARGEPVRRVYIELEYKEYGKVKDFDIK
jgi:hypothetical protein